LDQFISHWLAQTQRIQYSLISQGRKGLMKFLANPYAFFMRGWAYFNLGSYMARGIGPDIISTQTGGKRAPREQKHVIRRPTGKGLEGAKKQGGPSLGILAPWREVFDSFTRSPLFVGMSVGQPV
jgi:hypothetical protein